MNKTLRLRRNADQTGEREVDLYTQHAEQWDHQHQETDQRNQLSNGRSAEDETSLSNGVPANDGSNEETRPVNNPPIVAKDGSQHDCTHCHHVGDKVKEYIWVESRPKEILTETRSKEDVLIRSIRPAPITIKRKPFIAKPDSKLRNAGTARAYVAATEDKPYGTTHRDWARNHSHQTVLQQHCEFFDTDRDGIIWPQDTFHGFHKLGFGLVLSLFAVFVIHANFSYPTLPSWLPDPFFRIYIANIHKDKHGSDTGTYDNEGRFVPQKFEDIFEKYADGRDFMTLWDVGDMLKGQRCIADPIGWGGALFEWLATYLMLWPDDGRMMKEDIRGIYDGSVFYKIAARRASNRAYGYE
ncbi:Caleosin-domain-containing protein [Karstenula rhodostoma CBS 690.94]|uniref:Caleosin-domain-containing protein n=1 Tax=Karstenula rhodostoma CBS 690.94 TaxID=1392251 RepID=A0A9P4U4X4_9PLEO|nr:Caleosin-domain-containing protein [Karstenula rhodostoma CBS 690.94]